MQISNSNTCQLCGEINETTHKLGLHLYEKHMPKSKYGPFVCPVCRKKYKYQYRHGLALHWYRTHTLKESSVVPEDVLSCPLCSEVLENNYRLGQHLYDLHMPKSKYGKSVCPRCKKKFKYSYRSGLGIHWYKAHFEDNKRKFSHVAISEDTMRFEQTQTHTQTPSIGQIKELLSTLNERERIIIDLRFGLLAEACTLEQIGSIFRISRERVRQIELQALDRFRYSSDLHMLVPWISLIVRSISKAGSVVSEGFLVREVGNKLDLSDLNAGGILRMLQAISPNEFNWLHDIEAYSLPNVTSNRVLQTIADLHTAVKTTSVSQTWPQLFSNYLAIPKSEPQTEDETFVKACALYAAEKGELIMEDVRLFSLKDSDLTPTVVALCKVDLPPQ